MTGFSAFMYLFDRDKEKNRKTQLKQTEVRVQTIPICTDLNPRVVQPRAPHTCVQIHSLKSCTDGWQIKHRGVSVAAASIISQITDFDWNHSTHVTHMSEQIKLLTSGFNLLPPSALKTCLIRD